MQEADEFYIYVSSLGSSQLYRNNTASQFTNNIYPGLQLQGDWSVGLVDIIYNDWFKIKKHDEQYTIRLHIDYFDAKSVKIAHETAKYIPTENISGQSVEDHICELEKNVRASLVRKRIVRDEGKLFEYDMVKQRVKFLPFIPQNLSNYSYITARVTWFFVGERCADLMGGKACRYDVGHGAISEKKSFVNDEVRYINIYSDIISRSFMGDKQVNILDVIPVKTSYSFNRPHIKYKKLLRSYIDSISIDLRSGSGEIIPFKDGGSSMCVLHFKRS